MKAHARSFCALRVDCFAPFAIACRPSIPRRPRCQAVAGLTATDVNQRPDAGRRGFAVGLILRPHRHRSLLLSQRRPQRRRLPPRRRVEPRQKSQAATPAASGQLSLRGSSSGWTAAQRPRYGPVGAEGIQRIVLWARCQIWALRAAGLGQSDPGRRGRAGEDRRSASRDRHDDGPLVPMPISLRRAVPLRWGWRSRRGLLRWRRRWRRLRC